MKSSSVGTNFEFWGCILGGFGPPIAPKDPLPTVDRPQGRQNVPNSIGTSASECLKAPPKAPLGTHEDTPEATKAPQGASRGRPEGMQEWKRLVEAVTCRYFGVQAEPGVHFSKKCVLHRPCRAKMRFGSP